MPTVVAIGATSAIVVATLEHFAAQGWSIFLVGRDGERLNILKADLLVRGAANVAIYAGSLTGEDSAQKIFAAAQQHFSDIDVIYIGYGSLTDSARAATELSYAREELRVNFTSVVEHVLVWAQHLESRKGGALAVIGSVAGDRGRKSNYLYGAAKGGLDVFLSGVRNRLASSSVSVTTIKPGFVDTPMTAHLKKGPLFASSQGVGKVIYHAITTGRDVVYVPWFWRIIMGMICAIPEKIFKRLSL